jgi:hypothetical protein
MEGALSVAEDQQPPDAGAAAVIRVRDSGVSNAYANAYSAAQTPGPRLAEMIEALDRASQRMASGQRAAFAAYGAEIDGRMVRDTVAIVAACDVLAAVRQNVTKWPVAVQKVIAQAMGDLASVTKR